MREQLSAAITADGHQRRSGGGAEVTPDGGGNVVDETRMLAEETRGVGPRDESRAQRGTARAHLVLPAQRGVDRREVDGRQGLGFSIHGEKPRVSRSASGNVRQEAPASPPTA